MSNSETVIEMVKACLPRVEVRKFLLSDHFTFRCVTKCGAEPYIVEYSVEINNLPRGVAKEALAEKAKEIVHSINGHIIDLI